MTRATPSRFRWFGWSLLLGACAVAGAEAATRFDDWSRYGTPIGNMATDVSDLVVRDSLGMHARPNAVFKYFRIDSLGFRGPDRARAELATSMRVITAGASETFGLYESPQGEWPRRLEARLSEPVAASGEPPLVLNAAFAGMSLPTVRQDIRRRLAQFDPAVVVYYPTPAQYLLERLPEALPPLPAHSAAPAPVRVRLRTTQRLRDAVKRLVPERVLDLLRRRQTESARATLQAEGTTFDFDRELPARLDAFEADLRGLVGDVRAIGAEPVLVIHAHRFQDTTSREDRQWLQAWQKFYPLVTGRELLLFDSLAALRMDAIARDSAVSLVDPRPALRASGTGTFADHTHFSDEGAEVVARAVALSVGPALQLRRARPAQPITDAPDASRPPGGAVPD